MKSKINIDAWESPKWAVITGASSGIGAEFALQLARNHFNLILIARRLDRLEKLCTQLSTNYQIEAYPLKADLSTSEGIHSIMNRQDLVQKCDLLIHAAGFGTRGKFLEVSVEDSIQMLMVHNTTAVALTHAILPGMIQRQRGGIIFVSSVAPFTPIPGNGVYTATKGFLVHFAQMLDIEYASMGIKTQALCPGFTVTEFHEVGHFQGFNRKIIPKFLWTEVNKVVAYSLKQLNSNQLIVIPGVIHRWVKRMFQVKLLRSILIAQFTKEKKHQISS